MSKIDREMCKYCSLQCGECINPAGYCRHIKDRREKTNEAAVYYNQLERAACLDTTPDTVYR